MTSLTSTNINVDVDITYPNTSIVIHGYVTENNMPSPGRSVQITVFAAGTKFGPTGKYFNLSASTGGDGRYSTVLQFGFQTFQSVFVVHARTSTFVEDQATLNT